MILYPHQQKAVDLLREGFRTHTRQLLYMPTGTGKTVTFSAITHSALTRDRVVWVIVPLNVLLDQTSEHFYKWHIPHSMIAAGRHESKAFKIHIVSKQTLERRFDKIKTWPDLVVVDECHINYDFQIKLLSYLPEHTIVIGTTATYERLDGKGLSSIYQNVVKVISIKEAIETNYLSSFDYYAPPLDGLSELHKSKGEYDEDELDALLKRRAVYGKAIDHYRELANKKKTLIYCRSIKSAEQIAELFRQAGFNFENLDGTMNKKKRRAIIAGLTDGRIDGITSVNLVAYGFDCPAVENIIMLRPTLSRALFMQMVGRGLRVFPGKKKCTIFDHVNNIYTHIDLKSNESLYDAFSNIDWNFDGTKKKKKIKEKPEIMLRFCPNCWQYFDGDKCPNCGAKKKQRKQQTIKTIDGKLIEIKSDIPFKDRPYEEKKEFHEIINGLKEKYDQSVKNKQIDYGVVKDMCEIADTIKYNVMWVYRQLNNVKTIVNIPLLQAIASIKNYKRVWVCFKKEELRKQIGVTNDDSL